MSFESIYVDVDNYHYFGMKDKRNDRDNENVIINNKNLHYTSTDICVFGVVAFFILVIFPLYCLLG